MKYCKKMRNIPPTTKVATSKYYPFTREIMIHGITITILKDFKSVTN